MAEGEGGVGGEWTARGSYRPIFYGSDQLFSSSIEILKNNVEVQDF
jgi:hypothetical protein